MSYHSIIMSCQSSALQLKHLTHMSEVLAHRSSFCAKPALRQRAAHFPRCAIHQLTSTFWDLRKSGNQKKHLGTLVLDF